MASEASETGFLRHVRACNNAHLPGERIAFCIAGAVVGWVRPGFAAALRGFPQVRQDQQGLTLTEPATLQTIALALSQAGHYRWRREAFDVRAEPDGPVLAQLDRGALPSFGVMAQGVHLNGLVQRADGLHVWIGRRASNKLLDPGKLDHVVAGGVPAGLTPFETLIKEAAEEASIPGALAQQARCVGTIRYAMERPEGLRRDHLHCYDLMLPESFQPLAADGEVEGFELWPLDRAIAAVGASDDFKFNVNLVLIDLGLRFGLFPADLARTLRAALNETRA